MFKVTLGAFGDQVLQLRSLKFTVERYILLPYFNLSRYLYAHEGYSEDLDGVLYYKSILVENFPVERAPYTCAVTLMEIGMIYAEKAMREEALTWFRKAYAFIKENYPTDQGLQLMVEIGFFDFVVESGFSAREVWS